MMPCFYRPILAIVLLLCLSIATPGFSRGNGDGGDFSGGEGGGGGLSNATTKKVVKIITSGVARCQTIGPVYRFDCYRQTYRLAANSLNGRPAYAGARKALIAVETTLKQIMAQSGDPQVASIRKGFQSYRAIRSTAVPKAKAELSRALGEAETVLLRTPQRTGYHYARIAEAINSNKVLLRSRLFPDGHDLFQTAIA